MFYINTFLRSRQFFHPRQRSHFHFKNKAKFFKKVYPQPWLGFPAFLSFASFPFLIKELCASGETAMDVAKNEKRMGAVDVLTDALEAMRLERSNDNNACNSATESLSLNTRKGFST